MVSIQREKEDIVYRFLHHDERGYRKKDSAHHDVFCSIRKFDELSYRTKRSARMHRAADKVVFASQTRLAQVCKAHFLFCGILYLVSLKYVITMSELT